MRALILAAAAALCACGQTATQPATTAEATGCAAQVTAPWQATAQIEMTVEASTAGPDCATAVATITVRDANGVAFTQAHPAAEVMTLAQATDAASMQTALSEWIVSTSHTFATSAALPNWPADATTPSNGEFPFYVNETLNRDSYLALRARDVPIFCYVQGMESLNCLALENGVMTQVGIQSFPG